MLIKLVKSKSYTFFLVFFTRKIASFLIGTKNSSGFSEAFKSSALFRYFKDANPCNTWSYYKYFHIIICIKIAQYHSSGLAPIKHISPFKILISWANLSIL